MCKLLRRTNKSHRDRTTFSETIQCPNRQIFNITESKRQAMKFVMQSILRALIIAIVFAFSSANCLPLQAEDNPSSNSADAANPLRGSLAQPATNKSVAVPATSEKNQTVRGKSEELSSSGSVDFIIIDPMANQNEPVTDKMTDAGDLGLPKKASSTDATIDSVAGELRSLQQDYEQLHMSLSNKVAEAESKSDAKSALVVMEKTPTILPFNRTLKVIPHIVLAKQVRHHFL